MVEEEQKIKVYEEEEDDVRNDSEGEIRGQQQYGETETAGQSETEKADGW